jgi:transposase InsO family protein
MPKDQRGYAGGCSGRRYADAELAPPDSRHFKPIGQGVNGYWAVFSAGIADGLQLRHDHASVYMSDDFETEIRFLGIESFPAFVRQPEGNRFMKSFSRPQRATLWMRRFRDLEELRAAFIDFRHHYNNQWILERLNCRTPAQARRDLLNFRSHGFNISNLVSDLLKLHCSEQTKPE